ncbi:MAG: DUF87 domain-containing protein [Kineosporiaceae bacterium]
MTGAASSTLGEQQRALAELQLTWVTRSHVVRQARQARAGDPPGLVVEGVAGTGKTHLLGEVREQVQQDGGYFFLVALAHGETFWESVLEAVLDGLWRPHAGNGATQLQVLLTELGRRAGASRTVQAPLEGHRPTRARLDRVVTGLVSQTGLRPEVRDTARALVLYAAEDADAQDVARAYFLGDEVEPQLRAEFGLGAQRGPERTVRHLSQLLAATGHSVIAVDQLDALVFRAASSLETVSSSADDAGRDRLVGQVAQGLMGLQEGAERTLVVLTCIPNSWQLIRGRSVATVADRFRDPALTLERIPTAELARSVVESRLADRYRTLGFTPPHPTWPVRPEAFASAERRTPRELLQRIDAHARTCLAAGRVRELVSFDEDATPSDPEPVAPSETSEPQAFAELDTRFEELRSRAQVADAFDHQREDLMMPPLLRAGLGAWIAERGAANRNYAADPPPSAKPALHAGLKQILDERFEAQIRWDFRAIASGNALAVQNRLRRAMLQSGIDAGDDARKLFILRNGPWPGRPGTKTHALVEDFTRRGGVTLEVGEDDLRTFEALRTLLRESHPALLAWLASRRPAGGTAVLGQALPSGELSPVPPGTDRPAAEPTPAAPAPAAEPTPAVPTPAAQPTPAVPTPTAPRAAGSGTEVLPEVREGNGARVEGTGDTDQARPSVGLGTEPTGIPFALGLESLRKHVAVFAGSGSGKTVLLRRLVEECALAGVSSIVLDPNNDLARLGDPWPRPPDGWRAGDGKRAEEYLTGTEVVVWTPRRESGRPLAFQPLPDFRGVLDDPDEFQQAVDIAVAALAPRAGVAGRSTKAERHRAVLRQAVEFHARQRAGSLPELVEVLADLPSRASTLRTAAGMAADMAQTLTAAMVNDPLFGGRGEPVDPGILLTPRDGHRARVSVVSLVGLPDEDQRQSFVSQLQMALFAWFKRHPAGDRPLGGLLVMDEAQTIAPSGAMTASTASTLALASQARKYGLGLVFATQAPKGLHNRVPGNAATQFIGYLNSPSQIGAARDIARAKGGDVEDISRLETGQFYVAGEGQRFRRVDTALCLSHHPPSPLTVDEVIDRARGSARGPAGQPKRPEM